MTQREEFEEWCKANKYTALYFSDNMYFDKATQIAWEAWQAAKSTFTLPDRMDYEFHGDTVISNPFVDGYNECLSDVIAMNEEYANSTGSDGWKLVPVEPTTEQYGGLTRDIIQWMRFTPSNDQHSQSLIEWLKNMGNEIPGWLMSENEINHLSKHVLSKGTIAAIIYKAMIEAAPDGDA